MFLNIEGLRGARDSVVYRVYVNLPAGAAPERHPELCAGSISLFGVRRASRPDGEHGGGITRVLEISEIFDRLALSDAALEALDVQFVTADNVEPQDEISVDRISVYRQGA